MSLTTGQHLNLQHVTPLPLPHKVINWFHWLAHCNPNGLKCGTGTSVPYLMYPMMTMKAPPTLTWMMKEITWMTLMKTCLPATMLFRKPQEWPQLTSATYDGRQEYTMMMLQKMKNTKKS